MKALSFTSFARSLFAILFIFGGQHSRAASIDQHNYDSLVAEAQAKGAVRVMVQLATIPLSQISGNRETLKVAMSEKATALLQDLGTSAWKAGYWNNGLGQIGVYVTPDGLRLLRSTTRAEFFSADPTHRSRSAIHDPDGRVSAIESAISQRGVATVQVALNLTNIAFDLPVGGGVQWRKSTALNSELASALPGFLSRLNNVAPSESRAVAQSDRDIPSISMEIGLRDLAYLRESPDVRSIALENWQDPRPFVFDPEVLSEADSSGSAEVLVALRLPFPAGMGAMPEQAWRAQSGALAQVAREVLGGLPSARAFQDFTAFGGFAVRLSSLDLKRLQATSDARVLSVRLNKATGAPLLGTSEPTINMPGEWSAGYRGAGQYVVSMDAGIRKSHVFFQMNGATKVVKEFCFGSNTVVSGVTWQSMCPAQDSNGDSPPGYAGSGEPPAGCSDCSIHGPFVAGIAAGRDSPSMPADASGRRLQGVAPDAWLISVMFYSKNAASGAISAFAADSLKAFQTVYATAGGDSFVISTAYGGGIYQGNCDSIDTTLSNLIYQLKFQWRIPTVMAAGNSSARPGLAYPACLSHAIKVTGTNNDGNGTNSTSFGNTLNSHSNIAIDNLVGPILLAPGWDIISSTGSSNTSTNQFGGTSFAAPHVAGFYSVLKAAAVGITVDDATAWVYGTGSISAPQIWGGVSHPFRRIRSPA